MAVRATRSSLSASKDFLKSFPGVVRLLQLGTGAAVWITIASSSFTNTVRFALFVAVFFWLVTLLLYFITLLDKHELVPVIGGERWLLTNLIYDVVTTLFHIAGTVVLIITIDSYSFCNTPGYKGSCNFKTYVVASFFSCLCTLFYLVTTVYFSCKKCKGDKSVI